MECRKTIRKEYRKNNPKKIKKQSLQWHYDITLEEYDRLFNEQGESCSICETPQSDLSKSLGVDHDRIRG